MAETITTINTTQHAAFGVFNDTRDLRYAVTQLLLAGFDRHAIAYAEEKGAFGDILGPGKTLLTISCHDASSATRARVILRNCGADDVAAARESSAIIPPGPSDDGRGMESALLLT